MTIEKKNTENKNSLWTNEKCEKVLECIGLCVWKWWKSWKINKHVGYGKKNPTHFNANIYVLRLMHSNPEVFFSCLFFFIGFKSPIACWHIPKMNIWLCVRMCNFFFFLVFSRIVFEDPLALFTSKWVDIRRKQITKYEINQINLRAQGAF